LRLVITIYSKKYSPDLPYSRNGIICKKRLYSAFAKWNTQQIFIVMKLKNNEKEKLMGII
jgi:hypothetical protein